MTRIVLIPVKDPARAKTRLRAVLGDDERRRLATALARRAIRSAVAARSADAVFVVSRSLEIRELAEGLGAHAVDESPLAESADEALALNAALELARTAARSHHPEALAVLMADLPGVEPDDVDALFEALPAGERAIALAPAEDRRGLGALALVPADGLSFEFGDGRAFERYRDLARARGFAGREVERAGLAHDVDTPGHLAGLAPLERWTEEGT